MRQIRHINLTDSSGRVYCCLRNRIVELNEVQKNQFCGSCRMYAGNAGGKGVECVWEDIRAVGNPHIVSNPAAEMLSNQSRGVSNTDHLSTIVVYGA